MVGPIPPILNTLPGKYKSEEVLLYGIEPDSRYVTIDFNNTKDKKDEAGNKEKADNKNTANAEKESTAVYISSAYADKFFLCHAAIRWRSVAVLLFDS